MSDDETGRGLLWHIRGLYEVLTMRVDNRSAYREAVQDLKDDRDGLSESELADVVWELHERGLSFREITWSLPRDRQQVRELYEQSDYSGKVDR